MKTLIYIVDYESGTNSEVIVSQFRDFGRAAEKVKKLNIKEGKKRYGIHIELINNF